MDIRNNLDESHILLSKESSQKGYILYDSIYMTFSKRKKL